MCLIILLIVFYVQKKKQQPILLIVWSPGCTNAAGPNLTHQTLGLDALACFSLGLQRRIKIDNHGLATTADVRPHKQARLHLHLHVRDCVHLSLYNVCTQ